MSNIYTKTVKGRKYKYRCLRSWRDESGKVCKSEQYLGAVEPVDRTPVMARLHKDTQNNIINLYKTGTSVSDIREIVGRATGHIPSASTVYNFLKAERQ